MKSRSSLWLALIVSVLLPLSSISAQTLTEEINGIFSEVLEIELRGPGAHGNHFLPSRVSTSASVISAIGNLISTSASSFPLSSTSVGLTFDLSSGVPIASRTSAGPIFGERGQTLGQGRMNLGMNYSSLDLAKVRGLRTEDISFTLLHEDIGTVGIYGDDPNEHDYIELNMNLDLDARVIAFYGTYGLSDRIDIGIAIPYVTVKVSADPFARMNSYTYSTDGLANHFFSGTSADPVLTLNAPGVEESRSGIGDIALRAKWHAHRGQRHDVGMLFEARLATGDEENFLGQGSSSYKALAIVSTTAGSFSPYANIGYDIRTSEVSRNRLEMAFGYDQKLSDRFTLAVEWKGQYEMGEQVSELDFPDAVEIRAEYDLANPQTSQVVRPTNIPAYDNDHISNASFGVKWTPSPKFLGYLNIILPTNDGGLRSNMITTFGLEMNL